MSCQTPPVLNASIPPPPSTCCSPKDMQWFPICFERNSPLSISVQDVSINATCNLPSVTVRSKGQITAHAHSSAAFATTGCTAEFSFAPTESFGETPTTCNSLSSTCSWSNAQLCTNCTKYNKPIADLFAESLSACKQACENDILCLYVNYHMASGGQCLLFAECVNATSVTGCSDQTQWMTVALKRTGTSDPPPSAATIPAGYYEIGLHYACEQGACNTLEASTFRVTTSKLFGQVPLSDLPSPGNLTMLQNGSCIPAQLDQAFVYNITDICTSFKVDVTCATGGYKLRAAIGRNPKQQSGMFEWRDSSLGFNKTLYVDSFDERYREGYLYLWLAARSGATGACTVTVSTPKQHDQLLVLNQPSTKDGISWHQVRCTLKRCILNLLVVGMHHRCAAWVERQCSWRRLNSASLCDHTGITGTAVRRE